MFKQGSAMTSFEQPILVWGNGLGLRITAPVARAARLSRGSVVSVEVLGDGIMIRPLDRARHLTLEQKLKAFDPERHGGEVMASGCVGAEVF
jgi:antitoxin MazE